MENMRAVVYPPPADGLPHLAVIFHSDGSVALARQFQTEEEAQRYIIDISSSLVTVEPSGSHLRSRRVT